MVGHCVLVSGTLLEIAHHVSDSRLCGGLSSFFLNFVHLVEVLFSARVELSSKALLGLEWPGLTPADVADFEPTAHCGMHYSLTWSIHLLKSIESHVVQVRCTVEVPFLISHHLLKQVIPPGFPLFFLKQKVVGGCYLIVLVILNVGDCLVEIAVGRDPRGDEAVLYFREELVDHGDSVLADDNAFHVLDLDDVVPFVAPYLGNGQSGGGVGVQNSFDQVFGGLRDKTWDQKVAVQDLFVQLACVWVFEGEVSAGHSVQNDSAAPDIRIETVVLLACDHFGRGVTRASARSFQSFVFFINV